MATKSSSSSSNSSSTASSGKSSAVVSSSAPKASTPSGAKTTTGAGAGGYTNTTVKNSNGSTTSTSNKPQYGTAGAVTNADGSKTVYNSGGGYTNYDKSGNTTGGGAYGTENWGSNGGNIGNLPGYQNGSLGSSKDQSIAALGGDVNAINSLNNEQDLYNRLLTPQEALGLTPEQRQQKYQEYLQSAHAQNDPLIANYQDYLGVLKGQQQQDIHNLDQSYNQNANDMFANQFQQAGQLQQQMTERGLNGSGLSADALARLQMSGNSDLNKAFVDLQNQKQDSNKQYNQFNYDINTKLAELSPEAMAARNIDGYGKEYLDQQRQQQSDAQKNLLEMYNVLTGNNTQRMNNVNDNKNKMDVAQLQSNTDIKTTGMNNKTTLDNTKLQTTSSEKIAARQAQIESDKNMSEARGVVYYNNKPLLYKGKMVTTVTFKTLGEQVRHDIATENGIAKGQELDYFAAIDGNNAKREGDKLQAQVGFDSNQKSYDVGIDSNNASRENSQRSYDVGMAGVAANIKIANDQLTLDYSKASDAADAALGATTTEARKQGNKEAEIAIKIVQTKIKSIEDQVGKGEPTTEQKKQLKGLYKELDGINKKLGETAAPVNTSNNSEADFSKLQYDNADNGTPKAFGGYRYANGKIPSTFSSHMAQAVSKGVPKSQVKLLTELIGRESSFNYKADNPGSSAYGYGQFLTNSTVPQYKKKYPNLDYNNPVDQIVLTYHYVMDNYHGSVQEALQKWENRKPHWY